jgi:hypothetical protein
MREYDIAPGVESALRSFNLPQKPGFGLCNAPVMFSAEWRTLRPCANRMRYHQRNRANLGEAHFQELRTKTGGPARSIED